jgi:exopolysaccharide production protein ExoQ
MPPKLALIACSIVVLWFFIKEKRYRGASVSAAIWIPSAWAFILGSRPISQWFGMDQDSISIGEMLEGSPLDRTVLFALIAAGTIVLLRRYIRLQDVFWNNKWIFCFYFFLAVSVLWSDYSFISLRRWIKDIGNVVMALVVLSEAQPIEALKSMMLRCIFLIIPFSVVTIKYFPEISRSYNKWNYSVSICGIAGDKNLLGMSLFVCSGFLVYIFLHSKKGGTDQKQFKIVMMFLMLMTLWLLLKANSATGLVCTIVTAGTIYLLKRSGTRKLIVYCVIIGFVGILAISAIDTSTLMKGMLGRDMTLTGRTDLWRALLNEKINPLRGVGFYSFWLGDRSEKISETYDNRLNEAHNGYLETYLNNGLIGLLLLTCIIIISLRSAWRELKIGDPSASYRAAFLIGIILYNMSEATFNRLSLIWFVFLLVTMRLPRRVEIYRPGIEPSYRRQVPEAAP